MAKIKFLLMSDKDSHGKVSSLDPGPNGHIPIDYRGKFSVYPGNLLRNSTTSLIIDLNSYDPRNQQINNGNPFVQGS